MATQQKSLGYTEKINDFHPKGSKPQNHVSEAIAVFRVRIHSEIRFSEDASFLLTIGRFLLTVELLYLQLCLGSVFVTVAAFLPLNF